MRSSCTLKLYLEHLWWLNQRPFVIITLINWNMFVIYSSCIQWDKTELLNSIWCSKYKLKKWIEKLKKQKDYPGISNVFLIMIYKCSCPYSWIIFQMLDKPLIDLKPLNLKKN